MTFKTPNYKLDAFGWGDYYSARLDKNRMTIIDNQLAFLSDMAGEGVIDGWEVSVSDLANRLIYISPGMGIIGREVMQSFGAFEFNVENNKFKYIYMQSRSTETSGHSGHSNIPYIICSDVTAPSTPSGVEEEESLRAYNELTIYWDANTEPDFDYYSIKREISGTYTELSQIREILYTDSNLDDDTYYNYQITSVDKSGNESSPYSITLKTDVDERIPLPPTYLQIFPGNESFQIVWDHSASDYVDTYKISLQPLTDVYEEDGSPLEYIYDASSDSDFGASFYFIEGLLNYKNYRISVIARNNSTESQEISSTSQPLLTNSSNEIRGLDVDFPISVFENIGIEADVSWTYEQDPYLPSPSEFQITFVENGTRSSEPVIVLASSATSYTHHLQLLTFDDGNGGFVYESVKGYTPYLVIVQTITESGIISNGAFKRINRTPAYKILQKVSNMSFDRNKSNNNITIEWNNPSEQYLSYIKISIDLEIGVTITHLVQNLNIGQNTNYVINGEHFNTNTRYTAIITPVDVFGRDGDYNTASKEFTNDEEVIKRPDAPGGQSSTYGDTQCVISWDLSSDTDINGYKIYRVNYNTRFESDDFVLVGEVDSGESSFTDYDVENDKTYAYFVTSVNIYGYESLNPTDGFYPSLLQIVEPFYSGNLSVPSNVSVSDVIGEPYDVRISWVASAGSYDGYEIYRSDGNKYNFQYIGHAPANATSFIDEDVLLEDGTTYYYFVMTFRNEVNYVITESATTPADSILIATVETYTDGATQVVDIDNSVRSNLANLVDPIIEEVEYLIKKHKHIFEGTKDKRIEMSSDTLISEWTTFDYQTYSTLKDIGSGEQYIVRVTATVNESFFTNSNGDTDVASLRNAQSGVCPIRYTLNDTDGTIIFASPLYTTCVEPEIDPLNPNAEKLCVATPYSTEPTISLQIIGQSEVDGTLPSDKVKSLSASQVISSQIDAAQLPPIHHEGRIDENLMPLKIPTITADNFLYSLANSYSDVERNKLGTAITFYDIIQIEGDILLAATSNGILYSDNFGHNWSKKYSFSSPVYRVFKTSDGRVFAITNYNIYRCSSSDYTNWVAGTGLDGVQIIRDIEEDNLLNLYITSDLGIYKLNKNPLPFIGDSWQQLTTYGAQTSNTYAVAYDFPSNTLWVTNDYGILESNDNGLVWFYRNEFVNITKIRKFAKNNNFVFALSDNAIYRKRNNEINVLNHLLEGDFYNYLDNLQSLLDGDFIGNLAILTENRPGQLRSSLVDGDFNNGLLYRESLLDGDFFADLGWLEEQRLLLIPLRSSLMDGDFGSGFYYRESLLDGDFITQQQENSLNYFEKIATIEDSICRNIAIFDSKIYITTDSGIKVSNTDDIYTDIDIPLISTFSSINVRDNIVPAKSLNNVDDKLLIGTDKKLFVADDSDTIWLKYEQYSCVIPSFYINNEQQKIGFYYNNSTDGQNVCFDEKVPSSSIVEIVNKYNIYTAENNGWVVQKYDAAFDIRVNTNLFGESTSTIAVNFADFSNLKLPSFSETNSNFTTAAIYRDYVTADIEALSATPSPTGTILRALITKTYTDIEMFLSQLYDTARVIINDDGTTSQFSYPNINISIVNKTASISNFGEPSTTEIDTGAYANVANGVFVFEEQFDMYDTLKVDIYGCTLDNVGELSHREIEDSFELIYSGLTSNLSQVQQANMIKLGIFNETRWPGWQEVYSPLSQSNTFIPIGEEWFDTLNSTINYIEQNSNSNTVSSLPYASAVFHDETSGTVFVGGYGGLLKIDSTTLDVTESGLLISSDSIIKQIFKNNDIIYALTDNAIFKSLDGGDIWEEIDNIGLPNKLYSIGYVYNNLVIGAEDGIYYRASEETDWVKNISSNSPVEILYSPDLLFTVIDNVFYRSGDGYNFINLGITGSYNVVKIEKMLSSTYVATTNGLYTDNGSFYGTNPNLSLLNVSNSSTQSTNLSINDIHVGLNKMLIGIDNGSYYELRNSIFRLKEQPLMDSVHKMLYVNDEIWSFSYDIVQISSLDYPIKLSTGVPI